MLLAAIVLMPTTSENIEGTADHAYHMREQHRHATRAHAEGSADHAYHMPRSSFNSSRPSICRRCGSSLGLLVPITPARAMAGIGESCAQSSALETARCPMWSTTRPTRYLFGSSFRDNVQSLIGALTTPPHSPSHGGAQQRSSPTIEQLTTVLGHPSSRLSGGFATHTTAASRGAARH